MIVVVGAGPVGMVTALLLARQGQPCLVLERRPEPYPLPRAVHLDDECARILQSASVATGFARISRPAAGLRLLDARHRPLAEFRRSRLVGVHGHPQASLFDQPALESLLAEAVSREPLISVRRGREVTGVDASGRVLVDGRVLTVDAVVGCDGASSVVRRALGARWRTLARDQTWFVADLAGRAPTREWDGVEQICDPARPATYLRVGEDRLRWEFRLRPGESAAEMTERLGELVDPWTGDGVGERQVLRTATYTFRAAVASHWRRGRVLLAGDAAHLTPPFIGQGLGAGLRDAANLTWKLARVLRGEAGDDLLDTYAAERVPHVTAQIRLSALAGALMASPATRLLRPVGRSAFVREKILAGTSPPLRSGALTPWFPRGTPIGAHVPQAHGGDDLLGPGFALLTRGDPPAAGLHRRAARLGARVIRTEAPGLDVVHRWMTTQATHAVLVRPDRVVIATEPPRAQARDLGVLWRV
ncbi:bifunctional 3-(3-hydroxy-phenyl)propionate/3-hydroxycinnamic acid hydroxylase [Kineosporia succinea]|uniref:3-(3-hydroxy-phenyl)propionate hydroxylase n=1 Tax=Kineosporia succinea TaxID=84632 RepID=A0ABT9P7I2_9ACTN|nr:bifunctional 3-(3-hydroxy-phenyl)propionate/3-hydroxycinnamic acid hydroxylase [Kineosporia succinea]MDP9828652.1 3-(3-hydroxy-phenyl)propionate hydroxylase [Kineosporia succinea]